VADTGSGYPALTHMAQPTGTPRYYLGIDIGTSGVRGCVIDEAANDIAQAAVPLPAPHSVGDAIEQSPQLWWDSVQAMLHDLANKVDLQAMQAIAIDGTSGTVLLTDKHNHPLTPGLMYNDARARDECERIAKLAPNDSPARTITAGLPKLLWLLGHSPSPAIAHIAQQADWLAAQFTQLPGHSDVNNCLKSGYDPITQSWPDWLLPLGIQRNWLPQVHAPGTVIATIHPDIATQWNLASDTLIVAGTTDSHAAVMATGAQAIGDAVTSLGSTLVLKVISDKPIFAAEYGVYSQPFGEHWLVGGASNSGGAVLKQFFSEQQLRELSARLQPQQPTGLHYYPLPRAGERFPIYDPHLAPRLHPRPADDAVFLQAILEGIAEIEHQGYRRLAQLGAPYPSTVRSVGAGAQNEPWTRIRSQYLQVAVTRALHTDAAYGAALLAKQGAHV